MSKSSTTRGRRDGGFALILALLALMLLTFLGLTLTTTTSTELQIATNYRWSRQAYYNAEGGLEAGKRLLQALDWSAVLPVARGGTWTLANGGSQSPPAARYSGATRNLENASCDVAGGAQGYGIVFHDGLQAYENVSTIFGENLNGTFTLWIRRPTSVDPATGNYSDYAADSDTLILTAEGTAPYRAATTFTAGASGQQANRAVRVLEQRLSRTATGGVCGTYAGQAGAAAEGTNFGGCGALTEAGLASGFGAGVTETNANTK